MNARTVNTNYKRGKATRNLAQSIVYIELLIFTFLDEPDNRHQLIDIRKISAFHPLRYLADNATGSPRLFPGLEIAGTTPQLKTSLDISKKKPLGVLRIRYITKLNRLLTNTFTFIITKESN